MSDLPSLKLDEIYVNPKTGEKFRVTLVYNWGSGQAVSLTNRWDVIGIRPEDIANGSFVLVQDKSLCYHDWKVYVGFMKKVWYCELCNSEKEFKNDED